MKKKWNEKHPDKEPRVKVCAKEHMNMTEMNVFHRVLQEYMDQHSQKGLFPVLNGTTIGGNRTIAELKAQSAMESQVVEWKESWQDKYLEWICGYANAQGGTLYIGIDDNDNVLGLEEKIVKKLLEDIPNKITAAFGMTCDVNLRTKDKKKYIQIEVKKSKLPLNLHGRYYYRTGSVKKEITGFELTEFIIKSTGTSYDEMTSDIPREKLTFESLRKRYLKATRLSLALDDAEYTGGLIELYDSTMAFIKNNTKKGWRKDSDKRVELPDYPERALEEGLVNALIHRSYLQTGAHSQVDIYDDRIVITNPGGMFDGSEVQLLDIRHVPSKLRNPILADVFGRMRLMERRGSGFKKILDAYEAEERYKEELKPVFYTDGYNFFLTF
ncbi:ATP-binding protein [Butyrivibrio sp. YAB3001]|uniref:ATP-binding protein n=1 Tax=Butyrivibrio sp. YAB3001 TaxID=1520812 RepID=UPI0008F65A40|nr:ATP-binding protein [Butyrivibrio sp. YAB3001]SFD04558.1 Predicted transcriptional regulator, contains HTH domain [Butyrivibrio sp. YAB3001]